MHTFHFSLPGAYHRRHYDWMYDGTFKHFRPLFIILFLSRTRARTFRLHAAPFLGRPFFKFLLPVEFGSRWKRSCYVRAQSKGYRIPSVKNEFDKRQRQDPLLHLCDIICTKNSPRKGRRRRRRICLVLFWAGGHTSMGRRGKRRSLC